MFAGAGPEPTGFRHRVAPRRRPGFFPQLRAMRRCVSVAIRCSATATDLSFPRRREDDQPFTRRPTALDPSLPFGGAAAMAASCATADLYEKWLAVNEMIDLRWRSEPR
jgi:hypothetical protein